MYRYIAVSLIMLQILFKVESSTFNTRVEYKQVNHVPKQLHSELKPFEMIGKNFYFISNEELNWFQAAQDCRKKGGNLIHLTKIEELQLVGLQLNNTTNYWIDINNLGQDEYISIATGLKPAYVNWLADDDDELIDNKSKNMEQQNCVVLFHDKQDGFVMKKSQCLEKASFICQLSSPRTISILVW